MIQWLDTLFDKTYKRVGWLFVVQAILLISICFDNFAVSNQLQTFSGGNDIYQLLELKVYTECFFVRFLVNVFESNLSTMGIFNAFFRSLVMKEIIWFVICFIFVVDRKEKETKGYYSLLCIELGSFIVMNICAFSFGYRAYFARTTLAASQNLQMVGNILFYGSICVIILMLLFIFCCLYRFIEHSESNS